MNYALLERKLHTLTTQEIRELRRIADTVFEPLTRPFRQTRTVDVFDYKATIKRAQKIGHLIPTYSRQEREHRKSRLVIAMSLSGIDRCSAVSLILTGIPGTNLDLDIMVEENSIPIKRHTGIVDFEIKGRVMDLDVKYKGKMQACEVQEHIISKEDIDKFNIQ